MYTYLYKKLLFTIIFSVDRKDVQYFMYEHSTSYRQIQQKFINAVESLIPENIIVNNNFLYKYVYIYLN